MVGRPLAWVSRPTSSLFAGGDSTWTENGGAPMGKGVQVRSTKRESSALAERRVSG